MTQRNSRQDFALAQMASGPLRRLLVCLACAGALFASLQTNVALHAKRHPEAIPVATASLASQVAQRP